MRILMALSGGVDSSTALALLCQQMREGTAPIEKISAAYMKTWMHEDSPIGDCSWREDIEDCRAVCQKLDVEFEVVNLIEHYQRHVVSLLIDGYRNGITPNPDIACNRFIKFGALLDYATDNGFTHVATGHYCQRIENPDGTFSLAEGADPNKDQSYFLAQINPDSLAHALFPIGSLLKPEVRRLAKEVFNLPNATKKDSQGICFLGKVKVNDFLRQYIEDSPGPIVNHRGETVGTHKGLHHYTLGQRHGFGVPSNADNEFYVVVSKDYTTNTLHIAFDHQEETPGLYQTTLKLRDIRWMSEPPTEATLTVLARPRYRDPKVSATLSINNGDWANAQAVAAAPTPLLGAEKAPNPSDAAHLDAKRDDLNKWNNATITFAEPQRALAAGQIVAFYKDTTLIGSAIYK